MGLTTWRNAPKGKILKSDVTVAKNYLIEREIKDLERIVSMYLDYAENQAARQIPMKMADWVAKLDAFLQFNEYEAVMNDPDECRRYIEHARIPLRGDVPNRAWVPVPLDAVGCTSDTRAPVDFDDTAAYATRNGPIATAGRARVRRAVLSSA